MTWNSTTVAPPGYGYRSKLRGTLTVAVHSGVKMKMIYRPQEDAVWRSGDSPTHPDADSMLDDDDGDRS
jgi:hypothetical protein